MSNYLEPLVGNRMLGEGSVGIIIDSDDKGTIIFASPGTEKLFRVPYPGELLGRSVEELVPDDIRDKHRSWRLEFNANPRVRRMGLLMIRPVDPAYDARTQARHFGSSL